MNKYSTIKTSGLNFKLIVLVCTIANLVLFLSPGVFAATITSTATGGTWSTGSTWVGGTAPGSGDDVVIATTGSNQVTLTLGTTCLSLTVNSGATLNIAAIQDLTVTNAVNNSGTITGTSGRLAQTGTGSVGFTNSGLISLSSGRVTQTGTIDFNNSGTITFTGAGRIVFSAGLVNTGTINLASAEVRFTGTTTGNITSLTTTGLVSFQKTGGTLTFTGNINGGSLTINGTGGTLNLGTGLTHTFSGTWTRTAGTLNGGSSLLRINGSVSGTGGTFTAGTGTVEWYANGNQTIAGVVYFNLILSGSSAKTVTGSTVNGTLSMKGTATAAGTSPGYGGSSTLEYAGSSAQNTNSIEFPPTSGPSTLKINNSNGVVLHAARSVSNLVLTAGLFNTTTSLLLSVTNTSTGAVSGGSSASFVNGPIRWSLGIGTYVFPTGKSTSSYFPFTMAVSVAGSPIVTVEAFNIDVGSGATFDGTLLSISHTEYWQATLTSGTLTGSVSLTRVAPLTTENTIAKSTAQAGSYAPIGGTPSSPSINNSNNINSLGFFVMGTLLMNNCPASTSIAPAAPQAVCLNASTTQLTATVTLSGGAGSPTLLYQWYYNTTNSNTIAGATLIAGATSSTYTPPSSSSGIRYYFCVGYATNNGCGQTNATQSLASNTVQVTVNTIPGAVTVSGGGTFCNSATLTASGGSGGTIYWQNTTSNGTSTTTPSTSQVVTASGTYYFRAMNANCWGTEGSAAVIINPLPTITLGSDPSVCQGTTTANLTYSATTGSPNQYSIDYDAAAQGQGFMDVINASLPASPIVLQVPAGASPATYNYVVTVRNSTTTCTSNNYPKTITVNSPPPGTPGAISGPANVTPLQAGLVYSIAVVPNAASYNWTVPTGWVINSGQGTVSITATSGNAGQNGVISVTASNNCSTSAASTLAVTVTSSNCPQSTSVAPAGAQSICIGGTLNNLMATVTLSGGTGTPTLLYQWYFNNTNSNTIAGATLLSGATNPTFTPPNNISGTRYYFCVGYATNNNCGQTNGSQALASNPVQISVYSAIPSTPGSISGPANVGPATSGLIYSVAAMTDVASYTWTVPAGWTINSGQGSNSISVTSGSIGQNGNITVAASNPCGTGSPASLAVTVVNAPPTITLGPNPTVCQGNTSANLTYSATTNNPDKYSIDYNSVANSQGFVDVIDAPLPASPIVLVVPAGAPVSTYFGTLKVKNSSSGQVSVAYSINIKVITTPATPGTIYGPVIVSQTTPGYEYSVSTVANTTTYTWTIPAGWTLTAGQGTKKITVTSGAAGQNGNITVTAGNSCGTSAARTLAVTCIVPTDHSTYSCNACHIGHSSSGVTLTNVAGNANLCMTCHVTGGAASAKPISDAMKAIPGTSGTSHAWNVEAVNTTIETRVPVNYPQMANRLDSGRVVCSTCHDQHNPNTYGNYLRASNSGDVLCKDCHDPRNVGRYIDNITQNKGSHPVGLAYPSNPYYKSAPTAPIIIPGGNVECSSCHISHYASSTDGNLLVAANTAAICTSCHIETDQDHTYNHEGMTCKNCHDTHNPNKTNIYLVGSSITTPNSGIKNVVFSGNSAPANYADGSAPFDGICEACHTSTEHYMNTSGGTPDARHLPATQKCTNCHPHNKGFSPVTDCFACHNTVTDKPGIGPAGGRRQIVDNNGNGTGTGGDFKRTSHHVSGSIPSVTDCIKCHFMGDHMRGTVKLLDPDMGYMNVITYNPANKASIEVFCKRCHDANGSNGSLTPFTDNLNVPIMDTTMFNLSSHGGALTCLDCHDNGHGSNKRNMLGPFNYTGTGTGTDLTNEEEGFCLTCHGASGSAIVKVHLAFSSYTNTSTNYFKHDPNATYRVHVNGETGGAAFGGSNRHVECVDCHNPHGAKAGTATAPALLPTMVGVDGVEPTYAGAGAPTGFTWQSSVTAEYQVCYKCHSSYTTLPTYLPGGWNSASFVANGLKKLTTTTNNQIADSRDMAREYNPSNQSFHPVMAVGKNIGINSSTFQTGWTYTSRVYCTSCHNNSNSATAGHGRGPHGSANLHLLDKGTGGNSDFKTEHNDVPAVTTAVCTKCHKAGSYYTGNTGSRFGFHYYHVNNVTQAECYLCHDTHGSEQFHLFNFNRNVASCISAYGANSQSSYVHAGGTSANSCTVTCHGTSHGADKVYYPAYN